MNEIATLPAYRTNDARVLGMLRKRPLTRYQIQELLLIYTPKATDQLVNKLLESMYLRNLVGRTGIAYTLTTRGTAALRLIDDTRQAHIAPASAEPKSPLDYFTEEQLRLMKRSPVRGCASAADLAPSPERRGSLKFLEFPSRFGDTLRYRDGRVTDMAGNPVTEAPCSTC